MRFVFGCFCIFRNFCVFTRVEKLGLAKGDRGEGEVAADEEQVGDAQGGQQVVEHTVHLSGKKQFIIWTGCASSWTTACNLVVLVVPEIFFFLTYFDVDLQLKTLCISYTQCAYIWKNISLGVFLHMYPKHPSSYNRVFLCQEFEL